MIVVAVILSVASWLPLYRVARAPDRTVAGALGAAAFALAVTVYCAKSVSV